MFLTPTNRVFGAKAQLAGMTGKAIADWVSRAVRVFPNFDVEEISKVLLAASARAEVLADDSRDTFEPESARPSGLEDLGRMLDEKLAAVARP